MEPQKMPGWFWALIIGLLLIAFLFFAVSHPELSFASLIR